MTLGENLRELRISRGLSQEEVARALFVSRQSVSKWENGAAEPGVDHLKALARLYGVSLDRLLLAEDPESPPEGSGPADGPEERPPDGRRTDRAYLVWTLILAAWCAVEAAVTMELYGSLHIPFSAVALVVGIWVRYPAMWVVTVCLFGLNLLLNAVGLATGAVTAAVGLAVNGVWLWMLTRPAMQRRFGMKG